MIKKEHLKDIDFRSREQRSKEAIKDFTDWYNELYQRITKNGYSDTLQAQLSMLSAVLWYLLPEKDYKQLTKLK